MSDQSNEVHEPRAAYVVEPSEPAEPREKRPPDPRDVAIGARIRARREDLGITQGQIAYRLGVQPNAVSYYEAGKRSLEARVIREIAKVLRCSVAYLLGEETREALEDYELVAFYHGSPPYIQQSVRNMLEQAARAHEEAQTTHGKLAK